MTNKDVQNEIVRISGVNPKKCMRCGKCTATCPAFDEMEYHPHSLYIWWNQATLNRF